MPTKNPSLVLASTSRYRAESLSRLNIAFETAAPKIDEMHRPSEPPSCRAARLASAKAVELCTQFPHSILIGSDQVASHNDKVFDKPGSEERAVATLMTLRGLSIDFFTAVCVHHTRTGQSIKHTDLTRVQVRSDLTHEEIVRYVNADLPFDCAGAFKVEALGISLFTAVQTEDPTALIGLPLIAVAKALREFGLSVP